MRKNAYAARLQRERTERDVVTKQLTVQLMADTLALTLNDPEVMGRDTFGAERLDRVILAWGERFAQCYPALTDDAEADYLRVRMDEALRRIFGPRFSPFEERYPNIRPVR